MLSRFAKVRAKKPVFSIRPDFVTENVSLIDFEILKQYGIKNCFIDLDSTVVERGKFEVNNSVIKTLKKSGMKLYIATNRPKSRDLKNLKEDLHATGVIHPKGIYGKPSKRYFLNALKDMNLRASETIMIGDRYFQDIFGANRAGLYSMLVHKLGKPYNFIDKLVSRIEEILTNWNSRRYTK